MVANNIVEIEGVNYAVVETFDIDNNYPSVSKFIEEINSFTTSSI